MTGWLWAGLAGLVTAVAVLVVFRRDRGAVDHRHAVSGAVAAGAAAFVATADLLVAEWRSWWIERPMLAALFTGALVLGLTFIFVDRVIEARRAKAMRAVFAGPIADLVFRAVVGDLFAARRHIESVKRPDQVRGDRTLRWSRQDGLQEGLDALAAAAANLQSSTADVRGDLLTGGAQMHGLYTACWRVGPAARHVQQAISRLRAEHTAGDDSVLRGDLRDFEDRMRYIGWLWNEVGRSYNGLVDPLRRISEEAWHLFGRESAAETGLQILVPTRLEGFEEPTHMYYHPPAGRPPDEEGAGPQPSG